MTHDFERNALDRVYDTGANIAQELRRLADNIDRAVHTAMKNEGTTESHRSTAEDLPGEIVKLVMWGLANAHLDAPSRALSELHKVRAAQHEIAAQPIADRLRSISAAHKGRTNVSDTIHEHIMMDGPDDARYEVSHIIDTDLLDTTAELLDPKGA